VCKDLFDLANGLGPRCGYTNLSLQTQLADGLTVQPGLLRRSRRGQFNLHQHVSMYIVSTSSIVTHIVCTKVIQCLGNLNLLLGVEEGICELFALTQGTLNDLESGDIAQEVANWLVWIVSGRVGVCFGFDGGEAGVGWRLQSVKVNLKQEDITIEVLTSIGTISTIGGSVGMAIAISSNFRFTGGAHCARCSELEEVMLVKEVCGR
jgi:hypothetical protein